jgi:UDP-N-acetyl-D-glucosamine dehydrogenase
MIESLSPNAEAPQEAVLPKASLEECSDNARLLADRIRTRRAEIAVMGLGYAGLPLAVEFARVGFRVTGVDVASARVDAVNGGRSPVSDVTDDEVAAFVQNGRLVATEQPAVLATADCVLICVPTPLTAEREADLSYVRAAARSIANHLHAGMLIILQSTCSPGTTRRVLLSTLNEASTGLVAGEDYFVAFAPERIDPGNRHFTVQNTPKIIGGMTPLCTHLATLLFAPFIERIVAVSSPDAAEMTKLLENAFRFVNISFINEMAQLCDRMGVDIWEVIDAAATKPFAFMPHYPGPGVGGHCIPVVPFFLEAAAREHGMEGVMIEAAGRVNEGMASFVVSKLERLLAERSMSLVGSRVLLLGAAYKANTDDVRESPILPILSLLRQHGAEIAYHDPFVSSLYCDGAFYVSLTTAQLLDEEFAAAVLLTDHAGVRYAELMKHVPVFLDTRGRIRAEAGPDIERRFRN